MKVILPAFLLFACLACTRQPVGVATANPAPPAPVVATPDPETQEAIGSRATEQATRPEEDVMVPERGAPRTLPRDHPVPAQTEIQDNQTARIENQGNVGNVAFGGPDDRPGDTDPQEPVLMTYQRSNCYGDCEAYTFDLRSGGLASLMVDQGEIARGLYNRQLYSVDYDDLNNSIDSLRGLELAPVYPVDEEIPTDIPYRLISLPDADGQIREVKVYGGAPPALQRFLDRLDLLIGEQSWERVRETDSPDRN